MYQRVLTSSSRKSLKVRSSRSLEAGASFVAAAAGRAITLAAGLLIPSPIRRERPGDGLAAVTKRREPRAPRALPRDHNPAALEELAASMPHGLKVARRRGRDKEISIPTHV